MGEIRRGETRYERFWRRVRRNYKLVALAIAAAMLITALFQCGAALEGV